MMLIDNNNSIIKSFRAKLDWAAERLSFQDSNVTIPATHTTRRSLESKYCSAIAQASDVNRMVIMRSIGFEYYNNYTRRPSGLVGTLHTC